MRTRRPTPGSCTMAAKAPGAPAPAMQWASSTTRRCGSSRSATSSIPGATPSTRSARARTASGRSPGQQRRYAGRSGPVRSRRAHSSCASRVLPAPTPPVTTRTAVSAAAAASSASSRWRPTKGGGNAIPRRWRMGEEEGVFGIRRRTAGPLSQEASQPSKILCLSRPREIVGSCEERPRSAPAEVRRGPIPETPAPHASSSHPGPGAYPPAVSALRDFEPARMRSRSLYRRILPFGPLGSSATNSIQRGYL